MRTLVARLRRARTRREHSSRHQWLHQLAEHIMEAQRTSREYERIVDARRAWLASHEARGRAEWVAAETWALASIELAVGHTEPAREIVDTGLGLLTSANWETFVTAERAVRELGALDIGRGRPREAAERYERALPFVTGPEHEAIRLILLAELAHARLLAWDLPATLDACAKGLAAARDPTGRLDDPYRAPSSIGATKSTLANRSDLREHVVSLFLSHASALAARGSKAEAEDALDEIMAFYRDGLSEEEQGRTMLLRAWIAYREGDYEEAERRYGELAQPAIDGDHTAELVQAALAGLGWTYVELGMADEAAGVGKCLLDTGGRNTEAAAIRARAALDRGRLEVAETWARRALDDASPLVMSAAHDVLAEVERSRGRLDEAVITARTSVAILCDYIGSEDPFLCAPLVTLGRIEAELGEASATDRFAHALRLRMRPNHPQRRHAKEAFSESLPHAARDDL